MLQSAAKVDIQTIPYRGTGPGLADLLAGRVPLMWATPVALIPHVQAGKVKALGVASLKRAESLPQATPIADGAVPGFNVEIWFGVSAPAKTPPEIVALYAKELKEITGLADVKERMRKFGFDTVYAGSDEFRKVIAGDHARYGKAVQDAGIAPK
jgi:tripartite-type tricarboxylate transporter receptor subunit TctC